MTTPRMLYIDDSGSEPSGLVIYGWIECDVASWRHVLRDILELRKALYRDHHVPPSTELHATKFINGRTRISTAGSEDDTEEWKTLGRAVAVQCLEAIDASPNIRIGSAYRHTPLRRREYYDERGRVYMDLITQWDAQYRAEDSYAFLSMDGDGTDANYFNAHRALELNTRHIIEDPMFHDSRKSQLVQMADLIAYTTFMSLNPHPGNVFGQGWRAQYLDGSDVNGGPIQM
jgi:hypothetical protein